MQDTTETEPGARICARGLAPTLTALAVSLAIAAVGVYELCGFGLHSLDRRPHLFSDGLATGGVIAATVAAGAAAGNLAWLLTAARRSGADAAGGDGRGDVRPAPAGHGGGNSGNNKSNKSSNSNV